MAVDNGEVDDGSGVAPSPNLDDLKAEIVGVTSDTPQPFSTEANKAESEKIDLRGRAQFLDLRETWSHALVRWIACLLLFQMLLTLLIGWGYLDFRSYPLFLPIVTIQTLIQIVGMGYIIVQFLYPGGRTRGAKR